MVDPGTLAQKYTPSVTDPAELAAAKAVPPQSLANAPGSSSGAASPDLFTKIPTLDDVPVDPVVKDFLKKQGSTVAQASQILAIPLRGVTAATVEAANLLGVPGGAELKAKLNPDGRIFPDAYISDVSDFYLDKASKAAGIDEQSEQMKMLVKGSKMALGMGANILADPVMGLQLGQLTKEAEEIQKVGGAVTNAEDVAKGATPVLDATALSSPEANARNLIGYRVPMTDVGFDIQGQPVQDAMAKLGQNAAVKKVAQAIQTLSPDTGDARLDTSGRVHDALKRGDPVDIANRYAAPKDALNMTADEDRVASALVEATPNLAHPDLPPELLQASGVTWADEAMLTKQMGVALDDVAQKMGVQIAPGREEAITQAAMLAKQAGAENLMDKFNAGVLTKDNIASKVIENHLPHVMNPAYQGVENLAEYEARLAKDEAAVQKTVGGTFVSSKDPTRYREIRTPLESANAQMKEQKGLDQFFITDPVKAQVARLIESKKLLRDSQYMDVVKDYGQRLSRADAIKQGLVTIEHPELEGKTVVLKYPDGSMKTVHHGDLYYPPEIASKVQYRVAPPALTGLKAAWRDYNRVFRSMIFMSSPGIRLGNAMDNVLKTAAVTGKDFIQAYRDATEVLLGKSAGFRSAPTAMRPNGVFYDGQALKTLLDRFGITRTGAWAEGMEPFLQAGKKLTFQEAMQRPSALFPKYTLERIQSLVRTVDTFGERGENSARAALFLQRLRAGYEPEQAASEVTKWLFDYSRNSPVMENVRFAMPFLQHPLKTAMLTPALLGRASGTYNFIQNTFPHVVANAFHDPVTQAELNTILPPSIRQRDGIAGPFISGNTWMAAIFGAGKPGPLGSLGWFDPRIGLRILNHFSYFSKGGDTRLASEMSPVLQGLLGMSTGQNWTAPKGSPARELDYANGNANVAKRASYMLSAVIGGISPFPNAEKMMMQAFGLVDPKHVEPNSVLIMKGLAGQFGGITDLDHDVQSRLLATHYAYMDQKKQFLQAVHQEVKGNVNAGTLVRYAKNTYGTILGVTPVQLFAQLNQARQEAGAAQLGAQTLGSGNRAGDFAARMKGLSDEMERLNQAYQTLGARYLSQKAGR